MQNSRQVPTTTVELFRFPFNIAPFRFLGTAGLVSSSSRGGRGRWRQRSPTTQRESGKRRRFQSESPEKTSRSAKSRSATTGKPTAARLFAPSQSMRGMEMDEGKARTQGDVEMDFACRNFPRRIRVRSIIGGWLYNGAAPSAPPRSTGRASSSREATTRSSSGSEGVIFAKVSACRRLADNRCACPEHLTKLQNV
jgi:hypothetical protein